MRGGIFANGCRCKIHELKRVSLRRGLPVRDETRRTSSHLSSILHRHNCGLVSSPHLSESPTTILKYRDMPRKDSVTAPASAQAQQEAATDGIDNYELPKSLVTRIAKSAVGLCDRTQTVFRCISLGRLDALP